MSPGFEDDPGEHNGLFRFRFHHSLKRYSHIAVQVITDELSILQGAVVAPDMARFPGHQTVSFDVPFRNRQNIAIHVIHPSSCMKIGHSRAQTCRDFGQLISRKHSRSM
jgi:hypothetical protein